MDANYENSGDHDSFYAELRKQILLLTTDEEEEDRYDDFTNDQRSNISRSTKRSSINNINGFSAAKSPGRYYDWTENDKTNNNSLPNWLLNLWRNRDTNGTGVFIPDINVKSRKRNIKPRRRKNDKGRMYKPVPANR